MQKEQTSVDSLTTTGRFSIIIMRGATHLMQMARTGSARYVSNYAPSNKTLQTPQPVKVSAAATVNDYLDTCSFRIAIVFPVRSAHDCVMWTFCEPDINLDTMAIPITLSARVEV